MIRAIFLLSFVIVGVIGCSSVELQRGKDLASAGVAYSVATSSLVDVTIDSMIDADSEAFLLTKLRPEALTTTAFSPEILRERLKESNTKLVSNAKQLMVLRASLVTVEAYFKVLQSLADNPQSETTATAVSTLSGRMNTLNKALKNSDDLVKPAISEEQKTALSGLSKLVADQIHGAKVGFALKRDAKIIGEAILLQEKILGVAEKIILGSLNSKNNRFYIDKVQRPFEEQAIDMDWVKNRRVFLKAKAIGKTSEALKAVREASKQMGKTWEKILSGVYDTAEMRQQIEEVEAIVTAMLALKQAEKPKSNN